MTPSVGRIVHLVADDGKCLAAIVTKVQDAGLLLTVFAPTGPTVFATGAEGHGVSEWHWPERAE